VCGVPFENSLTLRNFFPQGISGRARIVGPADWKIEPQTIDLGLSAGEEAKLPFTVTLPFDAVSGQRPVRIEFDLGADRHHQFTVYRTLRVGSDDLKIEASSRLNEQGDLEVTQVVTNRDPEPVSFKCSLFAPDRRRMMSQVIELRSDTDTKIYRLRNGQELIGRELWLRAEEIGGQRTLNFHFTAGK
ncbi:MAG TPA: NEW3 domain-containing protein, partial [Pirellulales bacterium]|nr:NEW3 domain-containing protein [Pirellulales bacterium]